MPAVNTSSEPTSEAVVLLCVHWFVADQARCAFFGWQDCTTSVALGAAGCGNLLATDAKDKDKDNDKDLKQNVRASMRWVNTTD